MIDMIKEAFDLQDFITGTKTGGIEAPRILVDIKQLDDTAVSVSWRNPATCGLSDCRYHNLDTGIHTDVFRLEGKTLAVNGKTDVFGLAGWENDKDIISPVREFILKHGLENAA